MSPRARVRRAAAALMVAAAGPLAPGLAAQASGATPATGQPAASAASAPAAVPLASWTSDGRDLVVGDVVTILVDEYTLAAVSKDQLDAQGRVRDIGIRGGMAGTRFGGSVGTGHDVEESEYGESSRSDRFQAEISARVVEIAPGAVRLEGTKQLTLDDHEQEVTITGWIRQADVATDNTVPSWKLADARIAYSSNGELGKAGGFWSKIFGWIIP